MDKFMSHCSEVSESIQLRKLHNPESKRGPVPKVDLGLELMIREAQALLDHFGPTSDVVPLSETLAGEGPWDVVIIKILGVSHKHIARRENRLSKRVLQIDLDARKQV